MGVSIDHTVWLLFEDGEVGQAFAEALPEKVEGVEQDCPCWWKTYADGRVVRLWSGRYGHMMLPKMNLPQGILAAIQRFEHLHDDDMTFVRYVEPEDLYLDEDGDYSGSFVLDDDDIEPYSITKNEMKYMDSCPAEFEERDLFWDWSTYLDFTKLALMRFYVNNMMSANMWPGDHEEMTEIQSWEDMNQGGAL